jgi:hypothetical protein
MEKGADRRRENLPTGNEVALLIPEEEDKPGGRDLILARRPAPGSAEGASLKRIHFTHPAYMPLHYVLLFPDGEETASNVRTDVLSLSTVQPTRRDRS